MNLVLMAVFALFAGPPAHAAPEPCVFGAPTVPRPEPSAPARILVELRLAEDTSARAIQDTLAILLKADLPVVVLVPPAWSSDDPDFRFPSRGVEVAVHGTVSDLVGKPVEDPTAMFMSDWRTAFRSSRKAVTRSTGTRPSVLSMPPPPVTGEAAIDEAGFSVLLVQDPSDDAPPRRARAYGGRTGRTRVVTEGVGSDACGAMLGTPVFSALDRVSRSAPTQVVTRVALPPDTDTASALALWWNQTAVPAGWKAWSAKMLYVRAGAPPLAPRPAEVALPPQSSIETERLLEAARILAEARRLPRVVEALTLTECFVGLAAHAVRPGHDGYTIPVVGPPLEEARSMLAEPTEISAEALRGSAEVILPSLQGNLPSLITVGDHTLTTGEYLVALARLAVGAPIRLQPVSSPDPYAPGGGWGSVR